MKNRILLFFLMALIFALIVGCGENSEVSDTESKSNPKSENKEEVIEEDKDAGVIARIGGKDILEEDFEKIFKIWEDDKDSNFLDTKEQGLTVRQVLREKLLRDTMLGIAYELEYGKGDKAISEEELNKKYDIFVKSLNENKEKKEFFEEVGITKDLIKSELRKNHYSFVFQEDVDTALRETYDLSKEDFENTKLTVNVRHILLDTEEEANEVLESLKAGEDFEILMEEKTKDDASKVRGGEIGTIKFIDMPVEFSKEVFTMKEGELKGPIKSVFGYHVVEMLGFETVSDMIEDKDVSEEELGELKSQLYQRALDIVMYEKQEELLNKMGSEVLRKVDVKEE